MNSSKNIALKIESLSFVYDKAKHKALNNINYSFEAGKIYMILGQNGSGKSTLLSCIDGINKNYCGNIAITVDKIPTNIKQMTETNRAKAISYVSQHNINSTLSVYDYIMLGRKPYINFSPLLVDHETVSKVIDKFSLNKLSLKSTNQLSGGEFQKVCIARAFAQKSNIILLDEPTNNLDIQNQQDMLRILKDEVTQKNTTAICVMHDINIANQFADELIFMKNGQIIASGTNKIINKALLKEVYGVDAHIFEESNKKYIVI